jgi:predicted nucleic acid-binding protein
MRIIDTNVFLRALMTPTTPQDIQMQAAAGALFTRVAGDEEEITTTEAVVHELFYMLCAKQHYGLPHDAATRHVWPIVSMPAFRLARKAVVVRAIQLFERNQALDFTDCLLAAYAGEDGHSLTTFDRDLAREAGVPVFRGA